MKLRFNQNLNFQKSVNNRKSHGRKNKKLKKKWKNLKSDDRNSLKWFDSNLMQYSNMDHLVPSADEKDDDEAEKSI